MDVITTSEFGRSLPAEFKGGSSGWGRLLQGGANVQSRGRVLAAGGLRGLGDDSDEPGPADLTGGDSGGSSAVLTFPSSGGSVPVVVQGSNGVNWSGVASTVQQVGSSLIPIIAAQNPGTLYQTTANGQVVVYSQPAGSTVNLPVTGGVSPYSTGSGVAVTTPVGTTAISSGTLMMVAVLGIVGVLLMTGRNR